MAANASQFARYAVNLLFTGGCEGNAMLLLAFKALGNATVPLTIALLAHFAG